MRVQLCADDECALLQVDLRQYINELMVSTGGCASAGYPIASCKIYSDKSYAFLEFRSVEEASNCMAFDGVAFKDSYLRVGLYSSCTSLQHLGCAFAFVIIHFGHPKTRVCR